MAPHLADMVTVSTIVVVAVEAMAEMIPTAIVDLAMIVAIEATDGVIVMMDTLLVESIVTLEAAMIATAAAEVTIAVVEEVDTLIAMSVVIATVDVHPEMSLQLPPMVIQLLAERAESHTEVETMKRDSPVVVIDC